MFYGLIKNNREIYIYTTLIYLLIIIRIKNIKKIVIV
jgi:hypothetical protein